MSRKYCVFNWRKMLYETRSGVSYGLWREDQFPRAGLQGSQLCSDGREDQFPRGGWRESRGLGMAQLWKYRAGGGWREDQINSLGGSHLGVKLAEKGLNLNDTNRFRGGVDFHAHFCLGGDDPQNQKVEEIALNSAFSKLGHDFRSKCISCGISRAKRRFCKSRAVDDLLAKRGRNCSNRPPRNRHLFTGRMNL